MKIETFSEHNMKSFKKIMERFLKMKYLSLLIITINSLEKKHLLLYITFVLIMSSHFSTKSCSLAYVRTLSDPYQLPSFKHDREQVS